MYKAVKEFFPEIMAAVVATIFTIVIWIAVFTMVSCGGTEPETEEISTPPGIECCDDKCIDKRGDEEAETYGQCARQCLKDHGYKHFNKCSTACRKSRA
jgi:hypothetical protein